MTDANNSTPLPTENVARIPLKPHSDLVLFHKLDDLFHLTYLIYNSMRDPGAINSTEYMLGEVNSRIMDLKDHYQELIENSDDMHVLAHLSEVVGK